MKYYDKDDLDLRNSKERDRMYKRFDENQRALFHSIKDHLFTFCEATTGSGKTTVQVAAMLDLLANGEIDKIVYIRVPDDRAQSIGFYPGTLEEKTALYWEPLWQALEELGINRDMAQVMESQGFLETKLDVTLRGTNLSRAGVIVDEIENFRGDTLKLVFTRFHDDVHAVALGDGKQRDQKHATDIFRKYCDFLADSNMGNKCELTKNYRGRFSSLAESFDLDG